MVDFTKNFDAIKFTSTQCESRIPLSFRVRCLTDLDFVMATHPRLNHVTIGNSVHFKVLNFTLVPLHASDLILKRNVITQNVEKRLSTGFVAQLSTFILILFRRQPIKIASVKIQIRGGKLKKLVAYFRFKDFRLFEQLNEVFLANSRYIDRRKFIRELLPTPTEEVWWSVSQSSLTFAHLLTDWC